LTCVLKDEVINWACWHGHIIPALGRLRQKDLKFEASLSYVVRHYLKKIKKRNS
jgi:hypothetical protein